MKVIVNGEVITDEQINQKLSIQKDRLIDLQMGQEPLSNDEQNLKIEMANEMIDELLLVQYGLKKNLKPNDDEVEIYAYNVMSELDEKEESLADIDYVKQNVFHSLVIQKVRNELYKDAKPEDNAILEDFYKRNKNNFSQGPAVAVRHIFFKLDQSNINDRGIVIKANEVLAKLKSGEDFADLAKRYSDCTSRSRGGDLGFITLGSTDKEFEKAVFDLDVQEISPIIETEFGLHIIQALKKVDHYIPPFEAIKDKLRDYLADLFCEDALYQLIDDLRNKAVIKYLEV